MRKLFSVCLVLAQLFTLISNDSSSSLTIGRTSITYPEKTKNYSPFLVSLTSEDQFKKVKNVDLICIIDVSGSMGGDRIKLVKESLIALVNLMEDSDKMALVTFASKVTGTYDFQPMTKENKGKMKDIINGLKASGGTNIYEGLKESLDLIKNDYSSGERITSMILLSDGEDNRDVVNNFKNYLTGQEKQNYAFTLNSFGYGDDHDAILMNEISKIKDGGYFFIRQLSMVQESFVEIYGSLSTVKNINVELVISSPFEIKEYNGVEDNVSPVKEGTNYTLHIKLTHFVYGKHYNYMILLDIPENIEKKTMVLAAKVDSLNLYKEYLWEEDNNKNAYEEYIKYISILDFVNSLQKAINSNIEDGKNIINNGIKWLSENYFGLQELKKEYEDVLNDLNNFKNYGKANLLSKLRELKYLKLGAHYSDENSYQSKLMDESYNINNDDKQKCLNITTEQNIHEEDKNFYYFTLDNGKGEINGMSFSEEKSAILIYDKSNDNISVKPKTDNFEICYSTNKITDRLKNEINFFKGVKFSFKKDFPFEFYTRIDGYKDKDITFNIQILKLETEETTNETTHDFEIKAYIIDENLISNPTGKEFTGFYDRMHRVGKIVIRQKEINEQLKYNYKNYLYVIIQKKGEYDAIYTNVEGQLSFISMDYTFADIPEGFYIFSNLPEMENNPHKYRIKLEPEIDKKTRIEFISSANELNCAVIKYRNNYLPGDENYYEDDNENFNISRSEHMGKKYIDIITNETDEDELNYAVLVVFSSNGGHITGTESHKLSYVIRYTTSSNYGIYTYNDMQNTDGKVQVVDSENKRIIKFYPLTSESETDSSITIEHTRFFIKLYKIIKQRQKTYKSIALFEYSTPEVTKELQITEDNEANFELEVDPKINYFFTLFTVSNRNNEILSYTTTKIPKSVDNYHIDDDNPFENECDKEQSFIIYVNETTENNYLMIKISDFDDDNFGLLYANIDDKQYKSVQPCTTNYLIIPAEDCRGKNISINIELKDRKATEYYLTIKLTNNLELYIGEKATIEIKENLNDLNVLLMNSGDSTNEISLFIQSLNGDFSVENLILSKSEIFGAQSGIIEIGNAIKFIIHAKKGDIISISSHIISQNKKKKISNYEINMYGYLKGSDCIYLNEDINDIEKYQLRIIGDESINIKYDMNTDFENTEPGILYMKQFKEIKEQICLFPKTIGVNIFYSMQIIDVSKQQTTNSILLPALIGELYNDILDKDEIRYYRQGTFESNPDKELNYLYNIRQIKGEIKVFVTQCNNYPNCKYTKEDLEKNDNNIINLNRIGENFIYINKAINLINHDSEKIPVYIILCISETCEYDFIINKSNSLVNLSKLKKYTSKINKNNIQKFSITPSENYEMIRINLYTHSGEVVLSNDLNCENIKQTIIGNLDRIEIPKSCEIKKEFEIYIQANLDSIFNIEYEEINDINYSKIESNIIHIENINKEKIIEFSPIKNNYFIKFIPINCEIKINYKINEENKNVISQQNIYYYNSDTESEKINKFTITTENNECLIYTYLEEQIEDFYSVLSEQVPYYLSLNKNSKKYKVIYPIANPDFYPKFRINLFEETPITIKQSIGDKSDTEINTIFSKDLTTSNDLLQNCNNKGICYLTLEIFYEKNEELINPILLEIIPKSDNEIPSLLLDNNMKQDFIKLGKKQHYMSKIQKDEDGEILFDYNHFSGEIIASLINIDKNSWKNRYYLPEQKEQLIYDKVKQKIIFTKQETNRCINGCYLFIEIHNFDNFKINNELNMDYSIYLKKNEKIINLKLNEFIMGSLLKTLDEKYIEYYSIEIPYSTNKLFIDYYSENTFVIINDNNTKPLEDRRKYNFDSTGNEQVYVIESEEDLKNKIFTIGIYTKKLENGISQFSLRVRAENKLYKNYIFSNTNTNNICETKSENQICYYIIPTLYIQKNSDLFIFVNSLKNSDELVISYKKINSFNQEEDDGKYIQTSKEQFVKNILLIENQNLPKNENENILIKVEVKSNTIINFLYTFKSGLYESLLSPNNKLVYSMNKNEELYLTIPNSLRSFIHFKVINGKGNIGYENEENNMKEIYGKDSSLILQSTENTQNKRIKISTDSNNIFNFYVYITIDSQERNINDINSGSKSIKSNQGFPLEFYIKITQINDYLINFNINNLKEEIKEDIDEKINDFTFKAYIILENILEKIKNDNTYVYDENPFIGKYEKGFGIFKLILTKEEISKYYITDKNNYIYIKIDRSNSNPNILNNIDGDIAVLPINNLDISTPENIYINGNIKKGEENIVKYKFFKRNVDDKVMRLEFSANSENIDYNISCKDINGKTIDAKYTEQKNLGKKIIDINSLNDIDSIIFEIFLNNSNISSNISDEISYTLRYRTSDKENSFKNYIQNKNVEIKEIKEESNITLDHRKIEIMIPSIKDSENNESISANYYMKIYERQDENEYIGGTISINENINPYKEYELNIKDDNYSTVIEIPNDKKDYYIKLNAITKDNELLSYDKPILIKYEGKPDEDTTDGNHDTPSCSDCEADDGKNTTLIIIIIVISVICLILILMVVHLALKMRKNKIEDVDKNENLELLQNSGA